jgi:hypothetical protein
MRLAVTPLLIVIGMALLVHLNISLVVEFERCHQAGGSTPRLQTYWDILTEEVLAPSGPIRMALTVIAFLPFAIAALFIRSPTRLYSQWVGLGVLLPIIWLFFILGTPQEPDWCFQPDAGDFGLGIALTTYMVLFIFTLPVFIFVTLIGISVPAKDTP